AEEQVRLAAVGIPTGVVAAGSVLPDALLIDPHGVPVGLYATLGERATVVVFYRGAWCPHCNRALRRYEAELLPELRVRGIGLVAISPQKPDGSLTMREKNELTFTVLGDPGNTLARDLGILTRPSDEVRSRQLGAGLDIAATNADGTTGLPMPTVLVLDGSGVIRWIDVHPNYATRTEPAEILAALDLVLGG
ncbi:MAG: peroxiredoxin-like family protein, partial [Gemmatimonadales bacterium]